MPYSRDLYQYDDRIEIRILGIAANAHMNPLMPYLDIAERFKNISKLTSNDRSIYEEKLEEMEQYFVRDSMTIASPVKRGSDIRYKEMWIVTINP